VNGGYDDGYRGCPCFWGTTPGSLVQYLTDEVENVAEFTVLDVGCGEGKNASYLSKLGCHVRAIDISELALGNAAKAWGSVPNIAWEVADVRDLHFSPGAYGVILAYGLLHCLQNLEEIDDTVKKLQVATRSGGYNIICALNDRFQQLEAHPGLEPCLVGHEHYLGLYSSWQVLRATDSDLKESHPHNLIEHRHSLTRILARKP
jgi:SAM-dependent methyltransferase